MQRKIEFRGKQRKFDCVVPEGAPEVFVEGISEIQVGMPITRILFHSVTQPANKDNDSIEQRITRLSLVIPTSALFEFIGSMVKQTTDEAIDVTEQAIVSYSDGLRTQIKKLRSMNQASSSSGDGVTAHETEDEEQD